MNKPIISQTQNQQRDEAVTTTALPCRGCTRQCQYYGRCNGKLWRLKLNQRG